MSELSDEASETELLNRSLTMWHGEGQAASHQELDIPLDLHTAASIGQYEVVKDSIERGEKDLDQKNRGGWTPLMYASYIGYDTVVRVLLQAGANVNMSTPEGQTPLMLAASCGNECAAAFLLQQGAELEMKDIHGWTALFHCTSAGHQQMVKEPFCGYSPLMEAATSGHEIIVQYLLNHGVKVDVRDSTGATARSLAMKYGHMKIVGLIDLHTAPVPKVLRRGTGKYEDLSSSDESYCAPQRQRPARKSRGPSIHEGPHALAKITAVRTGGKTWLHHEQIPPEGYVTFKEDGNGLAGGGLRYRDVISPINDHDVESSSSRASEYIKVAAPLGLKLSLASLLTISEENSFFTNDVGVIRTSSSSEGLDSDSAAKSSSRKHAKCSMKAKNRYGNSGGVDFMQKLEQDIDLRIFLTLTESDLKEIGITLFGPKRKMTSAIARWHSSARPLSDALELAYADRLEAEMQELAIQLHKRCEEVKGLKGQVSQEQELRAVVESCLMEQDMAWSNAQAQLQEVQGITRSPEGWSPALKALSLPELSALLEDCVGEMGTTLCSVNRNLERLHRPEKGKAVRKQL
ncbi:hypothetical protein E2320_012034 [Naja naja]|nr:hypothetical protein E2320_012034 [Naja naja]